MFSTGDTILFLSGVAAVFVGLPLVFVGSLLLAIPSVRRTKLGRRTGWSALAVAALLWIPGAPVGIYLLNDQWAVTQARARLADRTKHPDYPTVYGGIQFPAGSTVLLYEGVDRVESGSVPVPTTIAGLVLIGPFSFDQAYGRNERTLVAGVLAEDAIIEDVPCRAGRVFKGEKTISCTLSRSFDVDGYRLAEDTLIEVSQASPDVRRTLREGTLAEPALLFDAVWPARTQLKQPAAPAAELAHYPGPERQWTALCIPLNTTVTLDWGELHGPAMYHVTGRALGFSIGCGAGSPWTGDGFGVVAGVRHREGSRDEAGRWSWRD